MFIKETPPFAGQNWSLVKISVWCCRAVDKISSWLESFAIKRILIKQQSETLKSPRDMPDIWGQRGFGDKLIY